jgi:hypothetical protein
VLLLSAGTFGEDGELLVLEDDVFDLNAPDVLFSEQPFDLDGDTGVFELDKGRYLELERVLKPADDFVDGAGDVGQLEMRVPAVEAHVDQRSGDKRKNECVRFDREMNLFALDAHANHLGGQHLVRDNEIHKFLKTERYFCHNDFPFFPCAAETLTTHGKDHKHLYPYPFILVISFQNSNCKMAPIAFVMIQVRDSCLSSCILSVTTLILP